MKKKKIPKSRLRYATEEAWQNAQEAKRRYCREYYAKHSAETYARRKVREKPIREKRAAIRKERREKLKARQQAVEQEFSKVVLKLHFNLQMGAEKIYELLGGLITKKDINRILRKEKSRLDKLSASKSKPK